MAPSNSSNVQQQKSTTLAEVELRPKDREGRDIFAINAGLRHVKEEYLAANQNDELAGQTIVISIIARRE